MNDEQVRAWWKTTASTGQICFPGSDDAEDGGTMAATKLIEACEPATFGRSQQDVLDESYRKAGKLDPADFLTDFCPYQTGIIDEIEKMLGVGAQGNRIHCTLYNLNVSRLISNHNCLLTKLPDLLWS